MKKLFLLFSMIIGITKIGHTQKYYEKYLVWQYIQDIVKILPQEGNQYIIGGNIKKQEIGTWSFYTALIDEFGTVLSYDIHEDSTRQFAFLDMVYHVDNYVVCGNHRAVDNSVFQSLYAKVNPNAEIDTVINLSLHVDSLEGVAYSCIPTSDAGLLFGGSVNFGTPVFNEVRLIKLDAQDNVEWTRYYDHVGHSNVTSLLPAKDGGYYVLSNINHYVGDADIELMKIDHVGEPEWIETYPIGGKELSAEMTFTLDGNIVIAGFSETENVKKGHIFKVDTTGYCNGFLSLYVGIAVW